jgi:hypothetical protein
VAIASFSFTVHDTSHEFVLATDNVNNLHTNTTIRGYKITLLNVAPYPGTPAPATPSVNVHIEKL